MLRHKQIYLSFFLVLVLGFINSGMGIFVFHDSGEDHTHVGENILTSDNDDLENLRLRAGDALFGEWYREMMDELKRGEIVKKGKSQETVVDGSSFFKKKFRELQSLDESELQKCIETNPSKSTTRTYDGYSKTNSGIHCDIYVESGSNSYGTLMNEFDTVIWPSDTDAFGDPGFDIDIYIFFNDGSEPDSDGVGGLGGFFTPSRPQRIYVDSADISSWGYEIVAHEFQHLIHNNKDQNEELWVDEGCADYAIVKTYGANSGGVSSHLSSFKSNTDNDLTQFDNQMYDYGSCCAFITYLADQYGGDTFTHTLLSTSGNGFSGISSALSAVGSSDNSIDAYLNWLVANYLDDTSLYQGQYGYTSLDIQVNLEATYSSSPVSETSSVYAWGADYYRFRNGQEGLGLEFQGNSGGNDFEVWVVKTGGAETTVTLLNLNSLDYGFHSLPGFGSSFTSVIMIVTADSNSDYTFRLLPMDTTPPITSLSIDPSVPDGDDGFYVTLPQIELSADEAGDTYYYWNDNNATKYTGAFTMLEGENVLHYYSEDIYLNRETLQNHNCKLDTAPPITDCDITPKDPDGPLYNGWYVTEPVIIITGEPDEMKYYRWEDGEDILYDGTVEIIQGENIFYWWGEDRAGNVENEHSMTLKIDSDRPKTSITTQPLHPYGNGEWYNEEVTITLLSEGGGTIYYRWDDSDFKLYTEPFHAPEGIHELYYYSIDAAGNQEVTNTETFKTDTTPPLTILSVSPSIPSGGGGVYISRRPIINLTCNEENATTFYLWDGGIPETGGMGLFVEEGTHTLTYYSVDQANNTGHMEHFNISVDLTPPLTVPGFDPIKANGEDGWYNSLNLTFSSTSLDLDRIMYHFNYDQTPKTFNGKLSHEDMEDGINTIYYWGIDEAGNVENKQTYTFKLDSTRPVARLSIENRVIDVGEMMVCSASRSSDGASSLSYQFHYGDGSRSGWMDSMNASHTYDEPGKYRVELEVRDQSGLKSEFHTLQLEVREEDASIPIPENFSFYIILVSTIIFFVLVVVIKTTRKKQTLKKQNKPISGTPKKSIPEKKSPKEWDMDPPSHMDREVFLDNKALCPLPSRLDPSNGDEDFFRGKEGSGSLNIKWVEFDDARFSEFDDHDDIDDSIDNWPTVKDWEEEDDREFDLWKL